MISNNQTVDRQRVAINAAYEGREDIVNDMDLVSRVEKWTPQSMSTEINAFIGDQAEVTLMNVVYQLKGLDIAANEAVERSNLGYFSNWYGEH